MSTETAVAKTTESKFTEYVPFGAEDKIKLSVDMVKNLIAVKTKSGKTCSDTDAIKFIALSLARKLNPFEGDCFLIGYDGKDGTPSFSLITAHQAFLKRAELHPEYNGMKSGVIIERLGQIMELEGDFFLEGDKLLGGWATVFFKTREHPMHKKVRLQRFKKAWGLWVEDPAGMIVKCAEADSLRSSFPTMLGGMYLREEQPLVAADARVAKPIFTKPGAVVEIPPGNPAPPPPSPVIVGIHEMIKQAGISEATLLEFLGAVGLATDEKAIDELSEETKAMVVEQFEDFSTRIKEVVP